MTNPSGPISILCAYDASGIVVPLSVNTYGELLVDTGVPTTVDASDVTYTPTTPADWDGGIDPGNQDSANDQLAERVKDLEGATVTIDYPIRGTVFHDVTHIVAGNAVVNNPSSSQDYGCSWFQSPAANSDQFIFSMILKAGSYTLKDLGISWANAPLVDIDFKYHTAASYTNIVTGQDWYSAATTYNVRKTATFTVTVSGEQLFRVTVNGKNASSGGYSFIVTKFDAYLTAGDS